nr:hypothetical protein HmN_000968400 [Hymenolepis microstoma]
MGIHLPTSLRVGNSLNLQPKPLASQPPSLLEWHENCGLLEKPTNCIIGGIQNLLFLGPVDMICWKGGVSFWMEKNTAWRASLRVT